MAMIVSRKESSEAKARREAATPPPTPSGPGRTLTPEEKAAFLKARPDLASGGKD